MNETPFTPKFFSILRGGITKAQLQKDITAGLIVGIVALPLAIAFAIASGVSPDKGLITAIIAGLLGPDQASLKEGQTRNRHEKDRDYYP